MIYDAFGIPAMTGLSNKVIGGPFANSVMEKFPPVPFVTKKLVKYFIIDPNAKNGGYAKGLLGPIKASFQDANGVELCIEYLIPGLAQKIGANEPLTKALFALAPMIPAGWCQTVYTNVDADPLNNYCSLDAHYFLPPVARPQRLYSPERASVWVSSNGGPWMYQPGHTPIQSYSDGSSLSDGFGYMEIEPVLPQAQQVIAFSESQIIYGIWAGFAQPFLAASFDVALNGTAVQTFSGPTDIAQWLHGYLTAPLVVNQGDVLTLTYHGSCYPVRFGTDYGFDAGSYFQGGTPRSLVNGIWTDGVPFQTGALSKNAGFPFMLET
jgi:hypothetical protein